MKLSLLAITATGVSLSPCAVPATIISIETPEASVEAVWSSQALRRLLITRYDPIEDTCVGLQFAQGLDDGIPAINVEAPEPWAVEVAYTSRYPDDCHGAFPQRHRMIVADSASGFVDWPADAQDLRGVPDLLEVDVTLNFVGTRGRVDITGAVDSVPETRP